MITVAVSKVTDCVVLDTTTAIMECTSGPAATGGAAAGSTLGAPRSEGTSRRLRWVNALRHALVAIW